MHELAIAESILALVKDHVPGGRESEVRAVRVRVGRLSGVVADSLEFCFEALTRDTSFGRARLEIEAVSARCRCGICAADFEVENPAYSCPSCGGTDVRLVSGSELQMTEIELEDGPPAVAAPEAAEARTPAARAEVP